MTISVTICNLKIESFLCYNVQQFDEVWKSSNFLNDLSQLGKNHTRVWKLWHFIILTIESEICLQQTLKMPITVAECGKVSEMPWIICELMTMTAIYIYVRYIYTIYVDRCKQSWRRCTKCCGESALAWGETQVRGSNGSCGDDDDEAEMCPPWCCST